MNQKSSSHRHRFCDRRGRANAVGRRGRLDRNEPVSRQLRWLREAGFPDVDLVYRNRTFIVTAAKK